MEAEINTHQNTHTYLQFYLGKKLYAIDIKFVTEIIEIQPVTEVPDMPPHVNGVINLRGRVITLVDICQKLKVQKDEEERGCIVIVNIQTKKYGLLVDNVRAVVGINKQDIEVPSGMRSTEDAKAIGTAKVEGKLCILLSAEKLV